MFHHDHHVHHVHLKNKSQRCHYSCRVYPDSRIAPRRFPRQWLRMVQNSRILSKSLAALQPMLPYWKRMQRPSPVVPARQDLGTYLDIVVAPQPLGPSGPMAQGHLTMTETQDVDLIRSQAPKTNMHEVPSFPCEQHHSGVSMWINGICEKCNIPAYNKPKTLLHVTRMIVSLTKLMVFFAMPKQISRSACVNLNAFMPGYSSRLYDNCGSSKWRRVFT